MDDNGARWPALTQRHNPEKGDFPMPETVLNPAGSPANIIIDRDDKRHDGYTAKDAAALAGMHILNDIHTGSAAGIRETAETSRHAIRETAEVGRFATKETSDATRHLADLISRNLAELKNVDIHNADRTAEIRDDVRDQEVRTADRFRAVEKDFGQVRYDMVSGFKESLLDSAKNTASVQLEAAKNAAAAALAAATNTAAIQAAIAECCCEQKELTRSEAETTRALINSLNTTSLERQLSDAKSALSSQQTSQGIINVLLDKLVK